MKTANNNIPCRSSRTSSYLLPSVMLVCVDSQAESIFESSRSSFVVSELDLVWEYQDLVWKYQNLSTSAPI